MPSSPPYKRILLKISGESLVGSLKFGITYDACLQIAATVKSMRDAELDVALVVGAGNIFRGVNLKDSGMQRTPADQMGMLGTIINGLALQQALNALGCSTRVMSALECPKVAESYNWQHAMETLATGQVLIFVGGTGNPYFTTDTAAALRASEIHADILLKATKVNGIYNKDPLKYPEAVQYQSLSYAQFLNEKLEVMDATAITLCRNSKIPVLVFNMKLLEPNQILQVLSNNLGTLVSE